MMKLLIKNNEALKEWLNATKFTEDTARIDAIPMTTNEVGKGDIVRFEENKILEVIEKNGTVFHATTTHSWDSPKWVEIEKKLTEQGIKVERFLPCGFGMVFPLGKEDDVDFILAECNGVELL